MFCPCWSRGFPILKVLAGLAVLGAGAFAVAKSQGIEFTRKEKGEEVVVVEPEKKRRFPF